jgi:hypothetical protein
MQDACQRQSFNFPPRRIYDRKPSLHLQSAICRRHGPAGRRLRRPTYMSACGGTGPISRQAGSPSALTKAATGRGSSTTQSKSQRRPRPHGDHTKVWFHQTIRLPLSTYAGWRAKRLPPNSYRIGAPCRRRRPVLDQELDCHGRPVMNPDKLTGRGNVIHDICPTAFGLEGWNASAFPARNSSNHTA